MQILGRHRVRASFYHLVSLVFLLSTAMWLMGWISDKTSYYITAALFITDYLAEMYDPHPDNPGPWFRAHFHRMIEGDDEERYVPPSILTRIKNNFDANHELDLTEGAYDDLKSRK